MALRALLSDAQAIPMNLLPPLLQESVRLTGLAPTMAQAQVMSGHGWQTGVHPKSATSEHPFAAINGLESLLKPGSVYGGEDHFQRHKAESALLALRIASIAQSYATSKAARSVAIEQGLTEGRIVWTVSALGVAAPTIWRERKIDQ